jgi:hypothetical protein
LRVSGNVDPDIEKPAPISVAELTVTEAVPVEERVTDCEVAEFTATLPNARLVALMFSVGTEAFSCMANVWEILPAFAVKVAACAAETAETVAENMAAVAPAGTMTEAGTATEELLLERLTAKPPLAAAAFSVTEQASVPDPVIDELAHESELSTGAPVPLRLTEAEAPVEELLAIMSCPVTTPAAEGSNCTVSVAAWFGFKVSGNVAPEIEKPAPLSVAELTVTAAVPVELRVTDRVAAVFTATVPKVMLFALMLRVGTAAFN